MNVKIEIELPESTFSFFKARAIIKKEQITKEISDFLIKEAQLLQDLSFKEAFAY